MRKEYSGVKMLIQVNIVINASKLPKKNFKAHLLLNSTDFHLISKELTSYKNFL
jgi:hypothetical protein